MSRIGKLPVEIPAKVKVSVDGQYVSVEGPLGKTGKNLPGVNIKLDGNVITVEPKEMNLSGKALWGLSRSLIANMVNGVSTGFSRVLEINGVGYRAEVKGRELHLTLGKSHPVVYNLPEGVDAEVEKQTLLTLKGYDKEVLGRAAAKIRSYRPPEPYKGKGVKYKEEIIQRKAGKAAKK